MIHTQLERWRLAALGNHPVIWFGLSPLLERFSSSADVEPHTALMRPRMGSNSMAPFSDTDDRAAKQRLE